MTDYSTELFDELEKLLSANESISGSSILEILKKYSSEVSVFDMMEFTSRVMEENKYVQENY